MWSGAQASGSSPGTEVFMNSVLGGVQWGLDRMLAVGYGVVYDYIFEQFEPYRALAAEVCGLIESAAPAEQSRRDVQVLDIACGPGNMTVALAEAGFSVVGMDPYAALVEVAREKRRAQHLAHVTFRHGDLADGTAFKTAAFDQVVNIHSLYLHPDPARLLREAHRVLKPGGYGVFVNRTRHVSNWTTFAELQRHHGLGRAARSLLWIVPNSVFEIGRRRHGGPHYWDAKQFGGALETAGFSVLAMRPTFLNNSSLLAHVRKEREGR
jgi:SAM-dependent methyltransferase